MGGRASADGVDGVKGADGEPLATLAGGPLAAGGKDDLGYAQSTAKDVPAVL